MIPDRDPGAGGHEPLRDRAPKPLRPAGDDGAPAVQIDLVHGGGPLSRFEFSPSFRGARSANPESRDSGSGPSDHPGMTDSNLQRPAAVDDMRDAGGERALVAGQIDREGGDLFRGAEPSHRLPRHEQFAPVGTGVSRALQHRGGFDGAGADAVAADAL